MFNAILLVDRLRLVSIDVPLLLWQLVETPLGEFPEVLVGWQL
jgi:hypothetical protein